MALSRAGVQQFITDLNESTPNGAMCRQWYDVSRKEVLEELPWPFAQRLVALALVEQEPNDDWAYSYRYPSDCLRMNRILGSINFPIKYQVGGDASGRLIYCNEIDPEAWYNADIELPGLFSSMFADALAWRITKELGALSRTPDSLVARAGREYMAALNRAAGHAQAEHNPMKRVAQAIAIRGPSYFHGDMYARGTMY